MIAHIYPSVLQAVSGWGYAGRLDGCFQGYRGEAMHYLGYELRRIPIPRTWVNKGKSKGRRIALHEGSTVDKSRSVELDFVAFCPNSPNMRHHFYQSGSYLRPSVVLTK